VSGREKIIEQLFEAIDSDDWVAVKELQQKLRKLGNREYPPYERESITRKFSVVWPKNEDRLELYLTVGLYEDGRPCDFFFDTSKMGDFPHGVLHALAMMTSIALQYGCPIGKIIKQWRATKFLPEGFTGDPEFKICTSLLDFIGRWLEKKFAKCVRDS
jgi:ribonucleoside-diphosphate reductase alpha chain